MISILIPTYNYNVYALVSEIHEQCTKEDVVFEIIVYDDASDTFQDENNAINTLDYCSYKILNKNIGRSAIRNLLAENASFPWLLFLDADVFPDKKDFIKNYLTELSKNKAEVIYGGIIYQKNKPEAKKLLRWIYGNEREALSLKDREKNIYLSFLTLNFLIQKQVFKRVHFNEEIPNLRYEDMLFSYDLMVNKITVMHIDNVVIHYGIENSELFLKKTEESLIGLSFLLNHDYIPVNYALITRVYASLKKKRLLCIPNFFYTLFENRFRKNLKGKHPKLWVYDLYRLGYFISLNKASQ